MLLGKLKKLEKVKINDYLENPIWVNDLSGESSLFHDETSIKPYFGGRNVTRAMLNEYLNVTVLGKANEKIDCVITLDQKGIFIVDFWYNGKWENPENIFTTQEIEVRFIPPLFGYPNQVYVYNTETHESYDKNCPPLGL